VLLTERAFRDTAAGASPTRARKLKREDHSPLEISQRSAQKLLHQSWLMSATCWGQISVGSVGIGTYATASGSSAGSRHAPTPAKRPANWNRGRTPPRGRKAAARTAVRDQSDFGPRPARRPVLSLGGAKGTAAGKRHARRRWMPPLGFLRMDSQSGGGIVVARQRKAAGIKRWPRFAASSLSPQFLCPPSSS
jgi:hypothetical protein